MKKRFKVTGILVLLLLFICAVPVNAASNKTVKKAYAKFLANSGKKYSYFKVLKVGTKKKPILLAQKKVGKNKTTSTADVYYYKNGKVRAIKTKSIETVGTAYLLSYKKGYLIIPDRWGGVTRVRITKNGNTIGEAVYCDIADDVYAYYTYRNGVYTGQKDISEKAFNKSVSKWSGNAIKFVKNTKANRKKYLGSTGK
jgi:hypothetical protein